MKKTIFTLALALAATTALQAQNRADQQHLEDPNSFSVVIFGDPQGYVKYDINQPLFELQTAWIADNVDNLNMLFALCTGDIVEQNDNLVRNRAMLNQTSREMWEFGSHAFERLDNKIPYIIATGNHEYGYRKSENGMTHFPEYFPIERNKKWYDCIVAVHPNRQGLESLENAAFEFDAPNWGKILVVANEFAPRDEVLDWSAKLISSDKYKDHKVIYITHSLLTRTGTRTDNEGYLIEPRNWGQQVWDKLIYPSENIMLAVCGHTHNSWYRVDKNASGKDVHQMLFNMQFIGGGGEGNGGDGWVRILEFMPDGKTIKCNTYSPLFGISSTTKQFAHRHEQFDDVVMVIE